VTTTRFPGGITTAKKTDFFGDFILPDETTAHIYFEDFDYYNADDWTVTEVGTATQTLDDADGGRLLIANSSTINDDSSSQKVGNSFRFEVGKKLWFDCIFQVNETTLSSWVIGLVETNTSPLQADNGVHFQSNGGTNELHIHVESGGVQLSTDNFATAEDATDIRLSYFYDGADAINVFVNGSLVFVASADLIPINTDVTPTYFIHNSENASKTMSLDYVFVAKER